MRVGFIGLGDIGMPMAERLIDRGFEVVGLDVDEAKSKRLAGRGATAAEQVSDLSGCEVIGLAVPDDQTVQRILVGEGLLRSLAAGSIVLIHSTILPATARDLQKEAGDVHVLDAPVSGGAARARNGDLVVMLGGENDAIESAAEVIDAIASTRIHAGPSGAGAAVKLANQLAMLAALAALQEGIALAEHFGADEQTVLRTLAAGTGDSWVGRNWGFFDDLATSYDRAGVAVRFRPWSKDLWDVVASGREAGVPLPLAGTLSQYLADAVEQHAAQTRGD